MLVACVFAGVLSLAAPETSYSETSAAPVTPIGATLFHDDFESGGLSSWTLNSGLAAQQSHVFRGSWAAEGIATGVATPGPSAYKDLAQGQTSLYYETWFNVLSHTASVNLLRFRNNLGGHNAVATLFVSTTGRIGLRNDVTATPTTSTTAVTPNAWHTAQVHLTIGSTTGSAQVWLDRSPVAGLSLTGINLGTNPIGRLELGDPSAGKTFDVAFDNVIADPAFIADSAVPTTPTGLHATAVGPNEVDLAWTAATDDVGVTSYQIVRNGSAAPVATVGGTTTSYKNTGLSGGTAYTYRIKALDAAGNVSPASTSAAATTAPKANQTITFGALPNKRFGDPDFNVGATASSGLAVSFSAKGNCKVGGATVHLTGPGSCTVSASQAGNTSYNAAPVVARSFSIAPRVVPPTSKRVKCRVPKVVGKGLRNAKSRIKRGHCRTGKVRYAYSVKRKKGIVISQSRKPGRVLPANSKVNIVVSRGPKH